MAKVQKSFQVQYTKFKKVAKGSIAGSSIRFEDGPAIITLTVTGKAYMDTSVSFFDEDEDRYSVDLEKIEHPGFTTLELVQAEVDIDDVIDFCTRQASLLFERREAV